MLDELTDSDAISSERESEVDYESNVRLIVVRASNFLKDIAAQNLPTSPNLMSSVSKDVKLPQLILNKFDEF